MYFDQFIIILYTLLLDNYLVQDLASPYGRIRAVSLLYINIFTMRARDLLHPGIEDHKFIAREIYSRLIPIL